MSEQDSRGLVSEDDVLRESVTQCLMCGGTRLKPWRMKRTDSRGTSVKLDYHRCLDCDCRVLSPRVPESAVGRFYGHSYAPYAGGAVAAAPGLVGRASAASALQAQLARTYPPTQERRRVLDFGCGSSTFLNAVRENGWETVGVDFTDEGLRLAREDGHEVRLVDEEFWPWLSTQQFDVVRLSHVIEHLYDPAGQVELLMKSLKPGGVLHVITPDPNGPACLLARNHCVFFEVVHVSLIPPASVAALAKRLGASQTHVVPERTTKDVWRSWLLKARRVTSYEDAPENPRSKWLHRLLIVLTLGASKLGRNDRYHAFVVR